MAVAWTDKHEQLAQLVAELAPIGLLLDLARDGVELRVDYWRKETQGQPDAALAVARQVVKAYMAADAVPNLLDDLGRRLIHDQLALVRLGHFRDTSGPPAAHQAALVRRDNTLEVEGLFGFMRDLRPRICVIAAEAHGQRKLGTGFLVGPDLVLTAAHTLSRHVEGGAPVDPPPGPVFAIFDHLNGPKIPMTGELPSVRSVAFANAWLEAWSDAFPNDGTIAIPDADQRAGMKANLDFALVRLAEPIGLETYARNGGRRRAWFPVDNSPIVFKAAQRIIIPQHPEGHPQRIDFGRFKMECPSGTRIRYDTETEPGTSGAPCFDEQFRVVGIHNAAYKPAGLGTLANQAVRLDEILSAHNLTFPPPNQQAVALWGVPKGEGKPRPLLGRTELLGWIDSASREDAGPDDRSFAVVGSEPGSGRRFTVEILRAAVRQSGDRIVELGTDRFNMPRSALDLMRLVLDQLGAPTGNLGELSPRPSMDLGEASDKLHEWASRQLPLDLDRILQRHRLPEVDARTIAADRVQRAIDQGFAPDPSDQQKANAPEPIPLVLQRWRRIWFVVRTDTPLPAEICDLIAGLMKQGGPELERLRWLFLGAVPDFHTPKPDRIERLDPRKIDKPEAAAWATGIAASYGRNWVAAAEFDSLVDFWLEALKTAPIQDRLRLLQEGLFRVTALVECLVRA